MQDKNKLIESVEECLGWPYVSPGTNDSRGIDCSGLFVKAYRDQGASIYHGSNTIYRKYCSKKGMLISVTQLQPDDQQTAQEFHDRLAYPCCLAFMVLMEEISIFRSSAH